MLTPEQIEALREQAALITDPVNTFLIEDICRRIAGAGQLTGSASYQIYRAQQLGMSQREIKRQLQKKLQVSWEQLEKLLTQSAEVGYRFDLDRFGVEALPLERNAILQQMVRAAVELAQDDFTNLTQTMGMVDPTGKVQPLQGAYRKCMDYAFKQVFTGAADYNTAVRQATRHIAAYGVRVIDYESGVHTSLEAAVRRNIMGGLGLLQEQITQQNYDALGADGWEISAHANSAPDHEPIQGRQYSDGAYKALNNSLQRRIGTLNCGHAAFPILLGVSSPQYTEEQLRKFREDNQRGVTYQGRHYTGYETTQKQREIERAIRRQKNRITADEATGDQEKLITDRIKLRRLNEEYKRFSKEAGLRRQQERTWTFPFTEKRDIIEAYSGKIPDATGTVPESLRHMAEEANETVCRDFPILRDSVDGIAFEPADGAVAQSLLQVGRDGTVSQRIQLDPQAFASEDRVRALLREHYEQNISYATDDPRSLTAHELGHAAHNALALKRAGWKPGERLTTIQAQLFQQERGKISQEVYLAAFTDETYEEIMGAVERTLGTRAIDPDEMIAQCFGNYYFGRERFKMAKDIVNYFKEELR